MQARIAALSDIYTDIRLLSAEQVEGIVEGARVDPSGEDLCYACRHKARMSRHCAAKEALRTKGEQCRLETFGPDIAHIISRYYEVDGRPYVLELVKRTPGQSTIDAEDSEALMSEASGYNMRLYRDVLTGAYNRRYYEEIARLATGPAGIAIMDLDDFKIYNDTYGHHAGDMTLEAASEAVLSCIRQSDTLIRYGGDEFLLILPGLPADHLKQKLEQIRSKVYATSVPGYSHLHLSLSIGGVMQAPNDTVEAAVRHADRLMYQAKNRKNSVTVELDRAGGPSPVLNRSELDKQQVLIVDDSAMNRMILAEILGSDYRILEASNGEEGLTLLRQDPRGIALVLLDIHMPVMDGFEVLTAMNRSHIIEDVPVIMISSEDGEASIRRAYELGASDYVNRPFDAKVVYQRVYNTIKLYAKQRRLVQMVSDQIRKQERSTTMLVSVLSQIVEFRNGESGSHVRHIRILTEKILDRLLEKSTAYDISPEEQDNIPLASALHDIGKIAIDEKILNKPGRLTPEEFKIIKTHTTQGANMLHKLENFEDEPLLQMAYRIARWHHERWDGRGYPDGLKGDEIPICAQIVSLADVYDALTSERCYKKAFSHEKAMEMILNGECGCFNPLLLECLVDLQGVLQEALKKDYQ